jgi:3-oxoacyl-[acyl-carrier-protein] synthase-1
MKKVWIVSDCIFSPLGNTTRETFDNVVSGNSGVCQFDDSDLDVKGFWGARIKEFVSYPGATRFETFCTYVIQSILRSTEVPLSRSILILSTTKGNIELLEQHRADHPRIHLHAVARHLADKFSFKDVQVVSNACISGVMAVLVARRLIQGGRFDHAIVIGADILSRFVIAGFQSLQALSPELCRPFDSDRKGINLGECAAAVIVTSKPQNLESNRRYSILGGGLSNDANHISGPSRTGEELAFAIQSAMDENHLSVSDIDFISAHGTATIYNDEMEAKAFGRMGLDGISINSMKGYFGHTLGAAGLLELAMCCESLARDTLIPTLGFEKLGVSQPINVVQTVEHRKMNICLKTASGFGGCNSAIILQKDF